MMDEAANGAVKLEVEQEATSPLARPTALPGKPGTSSAGAQAASGQQQAFSRRGHASAFKEYVRKADAGTRPLVADGAKQQQQPSPRTTSPTSLQAGSGPSPTEVTDETGGGAGGAHKQHQESAGIRPSKMARPGSGNQLARLAAVAAAEAAAAAAVGSTPSPNDASSGDDKNNTDGQQRLGRAGSNPGSGSGGRGGSDAPSSAGAAAAAAAAAAAGGGGRADRGQYQQKRSAGGHKRKQPSSSTSDGHDNDHDDNEDDDATEDDEGGVPAGGNDAPGAGGAANGGGGGKPPKKQRMTWTSDLHARFLQAIHQLGIKNAVPKTILQIMNVETMTRENVASHLQKFRLYLKKLAGLPPNAPLTPEVMQQVQTVATSLHNEMARAGGMQNLITGLPTHAAASAALLAMTNGTMPHMPLPPPGAMPSVAATSPAAAAAAMLLSGAHPATIGHAAAALANHQAAARSLLQPTPHLLAAAAAAAAATHPPAPPASSYDVHSMLRQLAGVAQAPPPPLQSASAYAAAAAAAANGHHYGHHPYLGSGGPAGAGPLPASLGSHFIGAMPPAAPSLLPAPTTPVGGQLEALLAALGSSAYSGGGATTNGNASSAALSHVELAAALLQSAAAGSTAPPPAPAVPALPIAPVPHRPTAISAANAAPPDAGALLLGNVAAAAATAADPSSRHGLLVSIHDSAAQLGSAAEKTLRVLGAAEPHQAGVQAAAAAAAGAPTPTTSDPVSAAAAAAAAAVNATIGFSSGVQPPAARPSLSLPTAAELQLLQHTNPAAAAAAAALLAHHQYAPPPPPPPPPPAASSGPPYSHPQQDFAALAQLATLSPAVLGHLVAAAYGPRHAVGATAAAGGGDPSLTSVLGPYAALSHLSSHLGR